jgi:hypothetical protein
LEVLPDVSLPGGGPVRWDNGNFALTGFTAGKLQQHIGGGELDRPVVDIDLAVALAIVKKSARCRRER